MYAEIPIKSFMKSVLIVLQLHIPSFESSVISVHRNIDQHIRYLKKISWECSLNFFMVWYQKWMRLANIYQKSSYAIYDHFDTSSLFHVAYKSMIIIKYKYKVIKLSENLWNRTACATSSSNCNCSNFPKCIYQIFNK